MGLKQVIWSLSNATFGSGKKYRYFQIRASEIMYKVNRYLPYVISSLTLCIFEISRSVLKTGSDIMIY